MQENARYKCYVSRTMFLNDVIQTRFSQARPTSSGQGLKALHFQVTLSI